jgi:hypothetical protein
MSTPPPNFSSVPAMDKQIYNLTAENTRFLSVLSLATGIDCAAHIAVSDITDFARLQSFVIRHRITIKGFSLILAGRLLALSFAYRVDIFPNEGSVAAHDATIELDEALLSSTRSRSTAVLFTLWALSKRVQASSMRWSRSVMGYYSVAQSALPRSSIYLRVKPRHRFVYWPVSEVR